MINSDYEAIELYAKGNLTQSYSYLWEKYIRLSYKIYRKYSTDLQEDNVNECFMIMVKCLNYVVKNKRHTKYKNEYLFFYDYHQFLRGYLSLYSKKERKYNSLINSKITNSMIVDNDCIDMIESCIEDNYNLQHEVDQKIQMDKLKSIFKEFFDSCDDRHKQLLSICIDKNSLIGYDVQYWVDRSTFLKRGYSKVHRIKKGITKQFFYKEINKLKRSYISFMKQRGYYAGL